MTRTLLMTPSHMEITNVECLKKKKKVIQKVIIFLSISHHAAPSIGSFVLSSGPEGKSSHSQNIRAHTPGCLTDPSERSLTVLTNQEVRPAAIVKVTCKVQ